MPLSKERLREALSCRILVGAYTVHDEWGYAALGQWLMAARRKPPWWMLYALVPLMGGLLVVESQASLSPGWHKGVQIGIILFIYGLAWLWLWPNDLALRHDRQVSGGMRRAVRHMHALIEIEHLRSRISQQGKVFVSPPDDAVCIRMGEHRTMAL